MLYLSKIIYSKQKLIVPSNICNLFFSLNVTMLSLSKVFFFLPRKRYILFLNKTIPMVPEDINFINPLQPEIYFSSIFEILPKTGSYRLPTHSRDAHRNFF